MARPDPFVGTRLNNLSDYAKDKIIYFGGSKKGFYKVYNNKLKSYIYIVGKLTHNVYKFSCFYYKKHWYRNEVRSNTYFDGTIDPTRIKVRSVGKRTQGKLLYTLWQHNWVTLN